MCSAWNEFFFFFFNDTATTEIYTLSLHDALPICFTEMGYTASINAAAAPWAYGVERPSTAYQARLDRKSTRLNSSHTVISYAVFCLKKKTHPTDTHIWHTLNSNHLDIRNTQTSVT